MLKFLYIRPHAMEAVRFVKMSTAGSGSSGSKDSGDICDKLKGTSNVRGSDPCKQNEDPCAKYKVTDVRKQNEDPCAKYKVADVRGTDPCKQNEDPCAKYKVADVSGADPCKKYEDPCAKYKPYMTQKSSSNKPGVQDAVMEELKSYFDSQIVYHKMMAKVNKAAMKRIRKIKNNLAKS